MPLQIKSRLKYFSEGRMRLTAWWLVLAIPGVLFVAEQMLQADGGRFAGTAHGNSTTGVARNPDAPVGSCVQCHDGHGITRDYGLWTDNDNNLCFTCHANATHSYGGQLSYEGSGHDASMSTHNGRPVGLCVQCHTPHGAGDNLGTFTHLTVRREEGACYLCHAAATAPPGALDIETEAAKPFAHQVADYRMQHDDWTESNPVAVNPNPAFSGAGRHVECTDCHNPHFQKAAARPTASSNIGGILLGAWGIKPTFSGTAWSAPTAYQVQRFADTATNYEYYLCLKCHSDWAWGAVAPLSANGTPETSTALEISPANPAYHNLTGQAAVAVPTDDVVFGTATPPAYLAPWGPNSAMACSDCHATDTATGSPRGPHGSSFDFMLRKRFKAVAGAIDNTGTAGTRNDLCFTCHNWSTYGAGATGSATNFSKGTDNLHAKHADARAACFMCHAAVPHGFKRKHLIVYASDDAPYYLGDPINYAARQGGIQAYAPANGGGYTINNCKTGCHEGHQVVNPVNPLP